MTDSLKPQNMERRRWIIPFIVSCIALMFIVFITSSIVGTSSQTSTYYNSLFSPVEQQDFDVFVESKVVGTSKYTRDSKLLDSSKTSDNSSESSVVFSRASEGSSLVNVARLAYLISGSKGDGERIKRALFAIYHPLNFYIVHLDREASVKERAGLYRFLMETALFEETGNVVMITKANLVTYRGPTMATNTLHAAAILLRKFRHWDWFINLSASDYPLVTQDDLLHTFSNVPRSLNFVGHTSNLAWKEQRRLKPMIVDPGLYRSKKSNIFWVSERRSVPTAFKEFTGSAWMMLSRDFVEYMIWGWDNLPRTLLLYHANVVSTPEFYFQTLICNSRKFRNTTVNSDLHFISWDNPPKQHPRSLGLKDFKKMIQSNAPFARKFKRGEPVLDKIDREVLYRNRTSFTKGGWCAGDKNDPCSDKGDKVSIIPGAGSRRLVRLFSKIMSPRNFRSRQCKA